MRKIHIGDGGYASVFEDDDGTLYLGSICGGIAWGRFGIVMNAEESLALRNDPSTIDAIARRMCRDPKPFEGREIPEALRSTLV